MSEAALKRRLEREREARRQAETLAEAKTRELFQANERLQAFSDNLEQLVEQRTAELEKARDQAVASSRAKSEFLANMSHEIRTPLNAVIGLTELMIDTELNDEQLDFCKTIQSSGESLLAIINDILDFSKIESGHLDLEQRKFDLREAIEQTLDLLAPKALEKELELAYIIDGPTPPMIVGDEVRLRQILMNLINNSIKFTEIGEVVLELRGQTWLDDQTPTNKFELHFTVRDTGLGIPPDKMNRLFKSFSQVDASTTRKYGGTGLGLAICQRLVELMNGRMWAESTGVPGEGSEFHFTIIAESAPCERRVFMQRSQPVLDGCRILIVDDNQTNRLILQRQAESWGMHVTCCSSGDKALSTLTADHDFELAIVDMQMSEMDGVGLAGEIRKTIDGSELPLVMLTSLGWRPQEGNSPLFSAMLTKPVKTEQLHRTLVRVVRKRRSNALLKSPTQSFESQTSVAVDEPSPEDSIAQRNPLSILLVEDNPVNLKVATNMLLRYGYHADVAHNGKQAVIQSLSKPYDVILMDAQMPEMDGVEATHEIRRSLPPECQPWIIAMTANALTGDRERFLAEGMDDYLSKPVKPQQLRDRLAAVKSVAMRNMERAKNVDLGSAPNVSMDLQTPVAETEGLG